MKTAMTLAALMLASTAHAAPILGTTPAIWSGPTSRACNGRCDQAWAETQLTGRELAQLRAVQATQPAPAQMTFESGTVFSLMTYHDGTSPIASRATTVASLDGPETAVGWQMNGWAFVRIDACQNWAVIQTGQQAGSDVVADTLEGGGGGQGGGSGYGGGNGSGGAGGSVVLVTLGLPDDPTPEPETPVNPSTPPTYPPVDPEIETPAPVPLPAAGWLLIAGIVTLVLRRKGGA